jgi:hypothetical protein
MVRVVKHHGCERRVLYTFETVSKTILQVWAVTDDEV